MRCIGSKTAISSTRIGPYLFVRDKYEFVDQWKEKSAMSKYTYGVYVILLDKKVLEIPRFASRSPEYDPDLDCYYVGMTAKTPEERFKQYKNKKRSSFFVREFGINLVPELYESIPRFPTRAEAKKKEEELAVDLREAGHAAYWNGDAILRRK